MKSFLILSVLLFPFVAVTVAEAGPLKRLLGKGAKVARSVGGILGGCGR